MPRIALIHAVTVALPPIRAAFEAHWPEATLMNLLDDTLSQDRSAEGRLTPAMFARFAALADYAIENKAEAILFTCSAFGPCIDAVAARLKVPVLKPNEAMFQAAARIGGRPGLLASFAPSIAPMVEEFATVSAHTLTTACIPEALSALNAGDGALHDRLLAQAAPAFAECDVLMLAQFSTARAKAALQAKLSVPVLTSPEAAVLQLRERF